PATGYRPCRLLFRIGCRGIHHGSDVVRRWRPHDGLTPILELSKETFVTQPRRREAVTWNRDGAIVEIVLDRPPANALGLEIITGLHTAMNYAQDADAKVIVVASAVDGFFAAGADIKHMSAVDATSFREYGDALRGALERLAALPMISVAAVDGLALGGGLELAMACTLRVGGARARLGLPEDFG